MRASNRASNYSLGLVVGIQNLFTKGSKEVERDYKKLIASTKKLQKVLTDVGDFEKASRALFELQTAGSATSEELREQSRVVATLQRRLRRSGVDTDNLADSQRNLQRELNRTSEAANNLDRLGSRFNGVADFLGGVGGAGAASTIFSAGMSKVQQERLLAAQTGTGLDVIQSDKQRSERLKIQNDTGAASEMVAAYQAQAMQSGFSGKEMWDLIDNTAKLSRLNPEWNQEELMQGQINAMQNWKLSSDEVANGIAAAYQKAGDVQGQLPSLLVEYSAPTSDGNISYQSFMAQSAAGKKAGARNYDVIGDVTKEFAQARLTDPTEFLKIVGDGKKAGELDSIITDKQMLNDLKTAAYQFRDAMRTGSNTDKQQSEIYSILVRLDAVNSDAARNARELIGGSRLAEDVSIKSIDAMAKAAANPTAFLGDTNGVLDKAIDTAISSVELAKIAASNSVGSMGTPIADLENLLSPVLKYFSSGVASFSQAQSSNTVVAAASGAAFVAASYLLTKGVFSKFLTPLINRTTRNIGGLSGSVDGRNNVRSNTSPISRMQNLASGAASSLPSMRSVASGARNLAPKLFGAPLTIGLGAVDTARNLYNGDYQEAAKSGVGTITGLGGAVAGAAIGTAILPGIGTAIGGAIGGFAGSELGSWLTDGVMSLFDTNDNLVKPLVDESKPLVNDAKSLDLTQTSDDKASFNNMALPAIEMNVTIHIQGGETQGIEEQVIYALRQGSPELIRQLSESMREILEA